MPADAAGWGVPVKAHATAKEFSELLSLRLRQNPELVLLVMQWSTMTTELLARGFTTNDLIRCLEVVAMEIAAHEARQEATADA